MVHQGFDVTDDSFWHWNPAHCEACQSSCQLACETYRLILDWYSSNVQAFKLKQHIISYSKIQSPHQPAAVDGLTNNLKNQDDDELSESYRPRNVWDIIGIEYTCKFWRKTEELEVPYPWESRTTTLTCQWVPLYALFLTYVLYLAYRVT